MAFSNRTPVTLADLGEFSNGVNFNKDAMGSGFGVINVNDIFRSGIRLDLTALDKVDLSNLKRIANYTVKAHDLFFVRSSVKRDGVGLVSYSRNSDATAVHCGFVIRFRIRDARANPIFLAYALRSPFYRETLRNLSNGTAIINISQASVGSVTVDLPPRNIQDRIASILSAYDDLIENNTRRIKTLEDMAQMIYREWFVHFRFPGHEKVRMVESELGPIPERWSVRSLRDVTSYISRGISPTYDESAAGWVINQKCIRDHRLNLGPARKQSKPVPSEKAVRKGDILINSTGVGTLGRVAQVHQELVNFTVDSHVSIVRPSRNADYLGELALQLEPSFEAMGVGSTGQTELGRERIAGTLFICPPDSLQTRYTEHAQGIHQLSLCLLQKNENLRTTRDFLLPKLISGEIPVDAAAELMEQTA